MHLSSAEPRAGITQYTHCAGVALAIALLLTAVLIRTFTRLGLGQPIRDEAPESHQRKRGTPTMGGLLSSSRSGQATWVLTSIADIRW